MTVPTITALPTPPTRSDPDNFDSRADAFLSALASFSTEMQASISALNTVFDAMPPAFSTYDSAISGGYSAYDVVISGEADSTVGKTYRAIQDQAEGAVQALTEAAYWVEINTTIGTQTIWMPVGGMLTRNSSGPELGSMETTTNKVMVEYLAFDASTKEYAQFTVRMPKSWDAGTVTAQMIWSHGATTTNFGVRWMMQGVAMRDGSALDAAFGTAAGPAADTGGTADTQYTTVESSAITLAGTPAKEDTAVFQIYRNPDDAGDTLAVDARLHGVVIFYTTDAAEDS